MAGGIIGNGILILLAILLALAANGVVATRNVSKEYMEMERKLKLMNKPALKTIQLENGDIIDCIDIYKQPSLDHPLLKNHTIRMRPSSPSPWEKNEATSNTSQEIRLNYADCPSGTIPIRRLQMRDLEGSAKKFGIKANNDNPDDGYYHNYAVLKTVKSPNFMYFGTKLGMNLWAPSVTGRGFSLSQIWISIGPKEYLNTIETGWMVYPDKYHDDLPHLFTYWTSDNYGGTGCYNIQCPGFVVTSQNLYPGMSLTPFSTYNGPQYIAQISVYKDTSRNWWLALGSGPTAEYVGYWPPEILPYLSFGGAQMEWGGEVAYLKSAPRNSKPPMGSGHFPNEGYGKSCFNEGIEVVDAHDKVIQPPPEPDSYIYADKPHCYNIMDLEPGQGSRLGGRYIYLGGPGGSCE